MEGRKLGLTITGMVQVAVLPQPPAYVNLRR